MSSSCLEKILDNLHPCVAKRRLGELKTNKKFLHILPFTGCHAKSLRRVLHEIAADDGPGYAFAMSRLEECWDNPRQVTQAMIDFLQSYTPVSDEELRLACWRQMSKDKAKILEHPTFENLCEKQPEIFDRLTRIYSKPQLNKRAALNNIDWMVENMTPQEREAMYLHLAYGTEATLLSSDITRLVSRCNLDITKTILSPSFEFLLHFYTSMKCIVEFLGEAQDSLVGTKLDPEYLAKLSRLLQKAEPERVNLLSDAVDCAYARLVKLPRYITRNYHAALKYGDDIQGFDPNKFRSEIYELSKNKNNEDAVFDVIYDVDSACMKCKHPQYELRPQMLPKSLLEAPTNILIDIHNALIDYLKSKGCYPEGKSVYI